YSQCLDAHPGEHAALFNTSLINLTGFLRDLEASKTLSAHLFPSLVGEGADARRRPVWGPGGASREQPASLCLRLAHRPGAVLHRFHYSIRQDGFLFLGRSESLLARSHLFGPVHLKWRIFRHMPSSLRQAAAVLPEAVSAPRMSNAQRADAASPATRLQRTLE